MLKLSLKEGEYVNIGDNIRVVYAGGSGKNGRLMIDAPREMNISTRDYYKYYTHGNYWTNPVNYDLTLNSDRVGVENCVKTIEQYLIIKGFIKADMIKPVGELI